MSRLYKVHSIREHKEVDGQMCYLVHWKKYSNSYDSWEPAENLKNCDKIIEEYQMKVKRQATPRRQMRKIVTPARRSSRLAMLNAASTESTTPQDSDAESNKDFDNTDNNKVEDKTKKKDVEVVEKKRTQQLKRHSQPNVMVAEDASKEDMKKRVYKRRSHASLVATGDLIDNFIDDTQMRKTYDLRQRVQPMPPPVHPAPSTAMLLSSDEEAETLLRYPVRRGHPSLKKVIATPEPKIVLSTNIDDKQHTVVKSVAKYKVTVQKGNLLVRKQEAKEPTEAATLKQDEEVKPTEPIVSDVEEEEIVRPSQPAVTTPTAVATTTSFPSAPRWMYFNCAEFLLALLITALLFITHWCWNSDIC